LRIDLTYGRAQEFRYRAHDINVLGRVEGAAYPLVSSTWSLNGGPETFVYVEHVPDSGIDWTFEYEDSPSVNRLKDLGDFNVEIPVVGSDLRAGDNQLKLRIEDASGAEVVRPEFLRYFRVVRAIHECRDRRSLIFVVLGVGTVAEAEAVWAFQDALRTRFIQNW